MILTLRVSHLIDASNFDQIEGIKALEYHCADLALDSVLPVLFHDGQGIIDASFLSHFDAILPFLTGHQVQVFSFDLGPAATQVEVQDYYYIPQSPVLGVEKIKSIAQKKITYMKDRFSGKLAVENLNFFPFPAYQHVCEPWFIREVVEENEISVVLDIGHALISAQNLSMNLEDYLDPFPVENVVEIHLSKPGFADGVWRDLHELPDQKTLKLLDIIFKRIVGDPYIVIEYYGDFDKLRKAYMDLKHYLN